MPDRVLTAACAALADGGIVAYPTEAVYGLGCNPRDADAVQCLLALKERGPEKGLILIADRFDAVAPWIGEFDDAMRARVEPTWPGPVTWLLPAATDCPALIRGAHETVAVRLTAHPLAAALCRAWGGALVSTSANRAGGPPARDATAVRRQFGDRLAVVIEGEVGRLNRPTPIRDARSGRTVRA